MPFHWQHVAVYESSTPEGAQKAFSSWLHILKKKCDERRPQCARCAEKDLACTYEAVKPRQRKKRDSQPGFAGKPRTSDQHIPSSEKWMTTHVVDHIVGNDCASPVEGDGDGASLFAFTPISSDIILSPTSTAPFEYHDPDDNNEGQCKELVRTDSAISRASHALCLPPDLAIISPCPVGSPTFDVCIPLFSEFSDRPNRRALVDHFCNVLSHRIVFREESGNPFQQLVLPLAYGSVPVMNAIYALASAHLEHRGIDFGEKSLYFHNEAIQGLAQLIEQGGKVNQKNELLAAIMLLVYYEVLVQRGRSSIVDGHLKGALTIMSSLSEDSNPTSVFLERAFRFYDVITALSLGTAPLSSAPAAGCLIPFPPLDAPATSPLCNVDTLLGMATTLWPIMHRLSNLLSLKNELDNAVKSHQTSKIAVLRTEFETTSRAIEVALDKWQPQLPIHMAMANDAKDDLEGDPMQDQSLLQPILHNALAYRHSAFVYLYRTIHGYSPGHELVQKHAHASLVHCAQTSALKGPMGALLWPLFVAACEAISPEDRALTEQTFHEVDMHQGMINIEKAWRVVREVWKQLDLLSVTPYASKDADLWRRVSKEMGVSIVFG